LNLNAMSVRLFAATLCSDFVHITFRYNSLSLVTLRSSQYLLSLPSAVHHSSAVNTTHSFAVTRQLTAIQCAPTDVPSLYFERHRRCIECRYFIYKSKPEKIYGNLTTLTTNSTPENQRHVVALRCKTEGRGFGSR